MIFKFRIVADGADNFKREIQIDAQATFLDLKNAICEAVGYDKTQLDSFFLCDDNWEKQKEITYEDMDTDSDQDSWLMEGSVLEDFIDDEGQRLLFVYDYMTDRAMFMEMTELTPGKTLKDPVCSLSIGQAPSQLPDMKEVLNLNVDTKGGKAKTSDLDEELDEEFYGSDAFSPDEFDAAGYEEMEY